MRRTEALQGVRVTMFLSIRRRWESAELNEDDRGCLTQMGRALEQLGVEHIGAYSPQARGRSERAFQTLQDRLVKELKLAGIASIEAANTFIREVYLPAHNQGFAVAAAEPGSAFTPIPGVDLGETLCVREERQVTNDNCVSSHAQIANPAKPDARCAPISSRRGSRSTSTPTAPAPSSMGPAASADMTRTERSKMRNTPLKSARRRASWKCGQGIRLAHSPTRQNKTRRSGHLMCYQNRTT
jgi:hypothetical protein